MACFHPNYFAERRLTSYLTVESDEPVTMTLSSYWRHSTEPVWPVNIFRHSSVCLSQIWGGGKKKKKKKTGEWKDECSTEEVGEEGQRRKKKKFRLKCFLKGYRFESYQDWNIFTMFKPFFMLHFPTAVPSMCVNAREHKSHSALPLVCVGLSCNNKTNLLFSLPHPSLL